MNYYDLNPNVILRFEFFGGLLINSLNNDEYELDLPNTIFLKCIENGFNTNDTYQIINSIIGNDNYTIYLDDFLEEKIIKKTLSRKVEINKKDFIDELTQKIEKVNNIKHLSFPKQVSLYLTSSCQLNCKFCFYNDKRKLYDELKSSDYWIKLIKKIKKLGVVYVSLLGGEPTIYKDIDNILKCLNDLKIKSTITTNGYAIKKSTFDIICNSKYITPTISIQSMNALTNKYLMGIDFSYADKIIKRFIKNGKIPRINTVITNQTMDELYNMVDYCVENGINEFYTDVYVKNDSSIGINSHTFLEYRKIKESIENYIKENNYANKINYQLQGCLLYSAYEDIEDNNEMSEYEKIKYGCEGGHTKVEIMPNGDLYPCVMFSNEQFNYDNVFEGDVEDIWYNSKYLNMLRNNKCKNDSCLHCKFYTFCNGGCPAFILKNKKSIIKEADDRCQIQISKK